MCQVFCLLPQYSFSFSAKHEAPLHVLVSSLQTPQNRYMCQVSLPLPQCKFLSPHTPRNVTCARSLLRKPRSTVTCARSSSPFRSASSLSPQAPRHRYRCQVFCLLPQCLFFVSAHHEAPLHVPGLLSANTESPLHVPGLPCPLAVVYLSFLLPCFVLLVSALT